MGRHPVGDGLRRPVRGFSACEGQPSRWGAAGRGEPLRLVVKPRPEGGPRPVGRWCPSPAGEGLAAAATPKCRGRCPPHSKPVDSSGRKGARLLLKCPRPGGDWGGGGRPMVSLPAGGTQHSKPLKAWNPPSQTLVRKDNLVLNICKVWDNPCPLRARNATC